MITQIRKVGNSAGIVIPSILLKEMQLAVGTEINLAVDDGVITIRRTEPRKRGRREVSLAWLLEDFKNVETDLIPGAVGAEVLEEYEEENYRSSTKDA